VILIIDVFNHFYPREPKIIENIKTLAILEEEKSMILGENATKLLGIR